MQGIDAIFVLSLNKLLNISRVADALGCHDAHVMSLSGQCLVSVRLSRAIRPYKGDSIEIPIVKTRWFLWSPQKEFLHLQYDILNWSLAEKLSHKVKLESDEICIRQQVCNWIYWDLRKCWLFCGYFEMHYLEGNVLYFLFIFIEVYYQLFHITDNGFT